MPVASDEVVKAACDPDVETLRVALPRIVLPSLNVTVPVGESPVEPLTVAVNVTDSPVAAGAADEARETVVLICCTVWLKAEEELTANVPSPP